MKKNYELLKVNTLREVVPTEKKLYVYNNYEIMIYRVNNDINGNPLYKILLSKDSMDVNYLLKGLVYRCYKNKGYSLIQSYDITNSLERIFESIEK